MKRGAPLRSDPAKARAWQARGVKAYQQRRRPAQAGDNPVDNVPQNRSENVKRRRSASRRNDGPWRNDVMARRGEHCVSCGTRQHVQADHVWPKGQGGPNDVRNGLPLCGGFGNGCHDRKTAGEIVIEWDWLDEEQRTWLAEVGWVAWDEDGQPYGRGWKHFGSAPCGPAERRVEG